MELDEERTNVDVLFMYITAIGFSENIEMGLNILKIVSVLWKHAKIFVFVSNKSDN